MKIKENMNEDFKLSFSLFTRDAAEKEIKLIDISKSQPHKNIPTKIMKDN